VRPKQKVKTKIGKLDEFTLSQLITCAPIFTYEDQLIDYKLRRFTDKPEMTLYQSDSSMCEEKMNTDTLEQPTIRQTSIVREEEKEF